MAPQCLILTKRFNMLPITDCTYILCTTSEDLLHSFTRYRSYRQPLASSNIQKVKCGN
jgi:hypothetical protein